MATQVEAKNGGAVALGTYLASIRSDRGLSLRRVEEITNREVSNAYLSQIENGKISNPSPNVLSSLADAYEINFEHLMELAGYIKPSGSRSEHERHGRVATFAEHNLTPDEEVELLRYLRFIRERR
ncbi:helix-turn-helix domain-containing protein [Microvirga puerhi]|uniref:Helix-turn-helix domain-containing protein n=1 Tax=Microvirga puerhi TaxID=2876078 RepID=A0ABS7VTE3_9HYPH|nr:helix-turn-helix transcriptional regulator [Microvirga puerhi]MBZ6078830.1 helix-turn-helix domain-containing protein [Microvirga puerhi]